MAGTARTATAAADRTPVDVDVAEVAARLRLSATRLARRLRQEADTGLTPSLLSALATIAHHGPMTLGALAERERVAPPSITRVVNRLVDDGLVTRAVDRDDARVVRVAATSSGESRLAASRRRKTAWLAERLAALDPDARRRLASALDALDALTAEAAS